MSLYDYVRRFRYCKHCDRRYTEVARRPAQNQTQERHRKLHWIGEEVYSQVSFQGGRNRRTTPETVDGLLVCKCGNTPLDPVAEDIEDGIHVSKGSLIDRAGRHCRELSRLRVEVTAPPEKVGDYVADQKQRQKKTGKSDDEILREAIEEIATGYVDLTRWVGVTETARRAILKEEQASPVPLS